MSNSTEKRLRTASPTSSPTEIEAHHRRPWPDLPPHLTELILGRLPLSDHIRFAAVCSKWQSIVRDEQPPMLKLPWLISGTLRSQDSIPCCSPFEQKPYLSQFPINFSCSILAIADGWILLFADRTTLHLLNPISGSVIKLPDLLHGDAPFHGFVSSSPTNAGCTVILLAGFHVFLWRIGAPDWTKLPYVPKSRIRAGIFCGRTFYCRCRDGRFFFIDLARNDPSFQLLELGSYPIHPSPPNFDFLVESNGEILMVRMEHDYNYGLRVVGFKVFRADLIRKLWVRMETLGGRVLFLNPHCSFSLSAAEAGVGENCIYFASYMFETSGQLFSPWDWKAFDLRSGRIVDGPLLPNVEAGYDMSQFKSGVHWFVPNLDIVGPDAAIANGTM